MVDVAGLRMLSNGPNFETATASFWKAWWRGSMDPCPRDERQGTKDGFVAVALVNDTVDQLGRKHEKFVDVEDDGEEDTAGSDSDAQAS